MTQPTAAPVIDIPLDEAVESLTGFEILAIEKRYRQTIDEMGAVKLLIGTVFCYENRDAGERSWASVEGMTLQQLRMYFSEPAVEPDSEMGKESSDGGSPT